MIDWTVASPALARLLTRLAFGVNPPNLAGQWTGRAQKYTNQETKTDLLLTLRSIQDIGEDETSVEEQVLAGVPTDVYAQMGNRRVILEVRIETYKNTDAHWAFSTIERIRTRLRRPSSHQALADINWALVETGPAVALPTVVRGAEWSAASMDVTFGTRFFDPEVEPFDWIERIEITSHVHDVDGQELPSPPNYADQIIQPPSED